MSVFLTGATGFLGGYVTARLLELPGPALTLLVRASDRDEAIGRLWRALQFHASSDRFREWLHTRIRIVAGDITLPSFGLNHPDWHELACSIDSVIHLAATLNHRSEKLCLNVNLRGTLEVIRLAQVADADHGLRRFSHVSTTTVAGIRQDEVVAEDRAIEWDRSDHDPYARTKKFCEHMVTTLLPHVPRTIFRPSVVLGDSRRPETTQFDLVRAFAFFSRLPVVPLRGDDRIDIVPADYVADAIVALHGKTHPLHEIYHLTSGTGSETFSAIMTALCARPTFAPWLRSPCAWGVRRVSEWRGTQIGRVASLIRVFLPYMLANTVYDNRRVVDELGRRPPPFSGYCAELRDFALQHKFHYPYTPLLAADSAVMTTERVV